MILRQNYLKYEENSRLQPTGSVPLVNSRLQPTGSVPLVNIKPPLAPPFISKLNNFLFRRPDKKHEEPDLAFDWYEHAKLNTEYELLNDKFSYKYVLKRINNRDFLIEYIRTYQCFIKGDRVNRWAESEEHSVFGTDKVKVDIDENIPEEKQIRDGVREYLKTISRNILLSNEFPELFNVNEFDKQWADLLLPFK